SLPYSFFFLHTPSTTAIYTLSLHDALPILFFMDFENPQRGIVPIIQDMENSHYVLTSKGDHLFIHTNLDAPNNRILKIDVATPSDRKSTRLNSSHVKISYAVFCLKKKKCDT